jgi:glycosyltransferase involved in cell wall biosynthesis
MTVVLHLTASRFFGGPERQMLGLGEALPAGYRSVYLSFWEEGHCLPFIQEAQRRGFKALPIQGSRLRLRAAARELHGAVQRSGAHLLCCHGYKANLLGLWTARRLGIPALSVSRGWTAESLSVRLYEALDRYVLRFMDHVVCVSEGQRAKVLRAGVAAKKTSVIHNSVQVTEQEPDPAYALHLKNMFAAPVERIVCAAGRLSPEKGFDVLVDAARLVLDRDAAAGFVLFGDGRLRGLLEGMVARHGMKDRFVLAGFHGDVRRFMPHVDIMVLPSFTEGLPNVALEACAAGKPVVATAVGGTPEVIADGLNGHLVPAGDAAALAGAICKLLGSQAERQAMGKNGQTRVREEFSFGRQSRQYQELLQCLTRQGAEAHTWLTDSAAA